MAVDRRSFLKLFGGAMAAPQPLLEAAANVVTTPDNSLALSAVTPEAATDSALDGILQHFSALAASAQKADTLAATDFTFKKVVSHFFTWFRDPDTIDAAERAELTDLSLETYEHSLAVLSEYRDNLHRVFDGNLSALDEVHKETTRLLRLRKKLTEEKIVADFESATGQIPDHYRVLLGEVNQQLNRIMQKLHLSDMKQVEDFAKGYENLCETKSYREKEKQHTRFVDELLAAAIDDHVGALFRESDANAEIQYQFNDALRLALGIAPQEISAEILYKNKSPWNPGNVLRSAGSSLQQKRYDTRAHTTVLAKLIKQLNLEPYNSFPKDLWLQRIPYVPQPKKERINPDSSGLRESLPIGEQPETLLQLVTQLRKLGDRVPKDFLEEIAQRYKAPEGADVFSYISRHYCKMPRARKAWIIEQASRPVATPAEDFVPEKPTSASEKPVQGIHTQRVLEEYIQHPGADEPGAGFPHPARRWPGRNDYY